MCNCDTNPNIHPTPEDSGLLVRRCRCGLMLAYTYEDENHIVAGEKAVLMLDYQKYPDSFGMCPSCGLLYARFTVEMTLHDIQEVCLPSAKRHLIRLHPHLFEDSMERFIQYNGMDKWLEWKRSNDYMRPHHTEWLKKEEESIVGLLEEMTFLIEGIRDGTIIE